MDRFTDHSVAGDKDESPFFEECGIQRYEGVILESSIPAQVSLDLLRVGSEGIGQIAHDRILGQITQ